MVELNVKTLCMLKLLAGSGVTLHLLSKTLHKGVQLLLKIAKIITNNPVKFKNLLNLSVLG